MSANVKAVLSHGLIGGLAATSTGGGLHDDISDYHDALANSSNFQAWVGVGNPTAAAAYIFLYDVLESEMTEKFCLIFPDDGWQTTRQTLDSSAWLMESKIKLQFEEEVARTVPTKTAFNSVQTSIDGILADLKAAGINSKMIPQEQSRSQIADLDRDAVRIVYSCEAIKI